MNTVFVWFGFIFSLSLLIFIARKNLWVGLFVGALSLGFFNMSPANVLRVFLNTVGDPSIVLLAVSVGLIPLIGGLMEESHLMELLVQNLRVGKKGFLMLSPALFGMLPMPGGALLSAPMVERTGSGVKGEIKSAINVWFRHLLIFIYPLGALLPTTKMAELNVYKEIVYLLPYFAVIFFMGYFFMVRNVEGEIKYSSVFRLKGLLIPLGIILIAPLLHFSFMRIFPIDEIALLIGVLLSLSVGFLFSQLQFFKIFTIAKKMRTWNYGLIIFGMFLFLNIFKASNVSDIIAMIAFSPTFLLVGIGAFLGFVTGRVQLPVSILLPIFFSKYGQEAMTPVTFAIMFFAIFMGYMISPIHPCVSVSLAYFKSSLKDYMRAMTIPVVICLIIATIVGIIIL